jgi:hypothetical protein
VIRQNIFPMRLTAKPSAARQNVRTNADAAHRNRRQAEQVAGHDLAYFLLKLRPKPSGRRSELLHPSSPFT